MKINYVEQDFGDTDLKSETGTESKSDVVEANERIFGALDRSKTSRSTSH